MKVGEYTDWDTVMCCSLCHSELDKDQVFYSRGVCPKCGEKHKRAITIVEYYVKPIRFKKINPTWKFWLQQWEIEYKEVK